MKGLVLLNSTSRADSVERIANRNRAIKAVKQNYVAAVRMSIANLFSEENRKILSEQIEWVREEALQTSLQGIIAAQEGMKLRKDREVILHFATYPILLILGKKDPVLNYEENVEQIESWALRHNIPQGDIQPLEKIWTFSKKWYGKHLNPAWTKWTVEEAKQIFMEFELDGKIWNLDDSKERF
jgi:hypothetical protein